MYKTVEGVGLVHLNTVKTVPAGQRHKWSCRPRRGETATCSRCGCLQIHQHNYYTFFRATPTSPLTPKRPPCLPA